MDLLYDWDAQPRRLWPDEPGAVASFVEAAQELGLSRFELERMVATGALRTVRVGLARRMVPLAEIERLRSRL